MTPPPSDLVNIEIPRDWFSQSLIDKYNQSLRTKTNVHVDDIVTLLNATIKKVNISGFSDSIVTQEQGGGYNHTTFPHLGTKSWVQALASKTISITFRHVDSYLTWLFLWETIQRQFSDNHKNTIKPTLIVDILNIRRQKAFSFAFKDCVLGALDGLDLNSDTTSLDFGDFDLGIQFNLGNVYADLLTPKTTY